MQFDTTVMIYKQDSQPEMRDITQAATSTTGILSVPNCLVIVSRVYFAEGARAEQNLFMCAGVTIFGTTDQKDRERSV